MTWKISAKRSGELDQQACYHRILHGWLLVHIPLSYALTAAGSRTLCHRTTLLRRNHAATGTHNQVGGHAGRLAVLQESTSPAALAAVSLSAVPVIAVVWFVSQRASGQKVYSSGPLSASHVVFGKQCEVCHVTQPGVFRKEVRDNACLRCHDAPAHHPNKVTFTPTCGSCHVEHKGSLQLAHTMDLSCAQCHTNLHVRAGEVKCVSTIHDFDRHHPEFAVLRPGGSDPGMIKLNHYAHLVSKQTSPNGPVQLLAGPNGPVQLTLSRLPPSCRRPWDVVLRDA